MKKSIPIYLLFFLLIIQTSLTAQKGEIWGNIYSGSEDSSLVRNVEVQLLVYLGHNLVDDSSYVKKTNSRGKYRLTNLPVDSSLIYYPRVTFNDIVYYGNGVRISLHQLKQQSDLVVFDNTSDKKDIFVPMEHLFLSHENNVLTLKEIFLINNRGKKTYMGQKTEDENVHYVLEFPLPAGYENLKILTPDAKNSSTVKNGTLYDTALFSPGSKQYSYQFQIPYKGNEYQYTRQIIYPTGGVNVFIENPQLTIQGPGVKPMGDFNIKGKTYQHYSLKHLMPGMQLELTLTNLPGKTIGFNFDIKWIVLLVVVGFLIVGFGYTFLKK
ncbi:hypothetical protein H8E88_05930 [candidate division KSB1 bacterium]|nr:hypothetical protein [candidate division KSB1 bacterium]MBL7093526.1 hypothetical protein [candidate division KSB1 bacterium]